MPPQVRITKEDIVSVSLDIVRESGFSALNARNIAKKLSCSTQPIFTNYNSITEIKDEVIIKAQEIYSDYVDIESKKKIYPLYKSYGMAYINFARNEKELFRLLFMEQRDENKDIYVDYVSKVTPLIKNSLGISEENARMFHTEMWACVHGIAVMQVTSFANIDEKTSSMMLTDLYLGLKSRYTGDDRSVENRTTQFD